MPLMICNFRENRYCDSRNLLMGTNEILFILKKFYVPIKEKNRYRSFSEKGVDWYKVLWKSVLGNRYFCYGHKRKHDLNYTAIMSVENPVAKSQHCAA